MRLSASGPVFRALNASWSDSHHGKRLDTTLLHNSVTCADLISGSPVPVPCGQLCTCLGFTLLDVSDRRMLRTHGLIRTNVSQKIEDSQRNNPASYETFLFYVHLLVALPPGRYPEGYLERGGNLIEDIHDSSNLQQAIGIPNGERAVRRFPGARLYERIRRRLSRPDPRRPVADEAANEVYMEELRRARAWHEDRAEQQGVLAHWIDNQHLLDLYRRAQALERRPVAQEAANEVYMDELRRARAWHEDRAEKQGILGYWIDNEHLLDLYRQAQALT
ncbi:hypothetical protein PTTG_27166 [Puccinia triticina 1-1 BBBD Race 1]|uniref:Uncharacterized protein n=1 Tax=Puccinia triticina (isolate 1-1 / race 1 (BBBD)) TaxID=630390 RepID=A0A180GLX7_PUCT1|nr:hypothetical protein PTTG_27166 [Puccinia triticina 1-1 BBBD Race 1]